MSKMMNVTPKTSSMLSMTRNTTMRTQSTSVRGIEDKALPVFTHSLATERNL